MSYVNPFGPPTTGEQKVAAETVQETVQPTTKKSLGRSYSAAVMPSPHKLPGERFQFLARRFSNTTPLSGLSSIPEGAKVTIKSENIGVNFNEILNVSSPGKPVEAATPSTTTNNLSDSVGNFKRLWTLPHCRKKIGEIAASKHMQENCAFLNSLTDYYALFDKKKLENIIEKHDHIVKKFLSKNATNKIHAELPPEVEFVVIGDQTFNLAQVFTLKNKFKQVEDIIIRTLAQNLMFDPTYQALLTTSLTTARQRMLSYV